MKRLLIPTVLLSLFFLLITLRVKTTTCSLQNTPCQPEEALEINKIFENKSLFFLNIKKELEKNEEINKLFILDKYQKEFPNIVHLFLIKREPVYQLSINEQNYLISKQGRVLPTTSKEEKIPLVIWKDETQQVINNQEVLPQVHQQLEGFLTKLKELEIESRKIEWLNENEIRLTLSNSLTFILNSKALDTKAEAVKLVFESKEIQALEEDKKEVDLRFKLPVLHIN